MKKYKRKTKKVLCNNCGNKFEKAISEIKRTEKKNGNHYCSSKCAASKNSKLNLGEWCGNGNYDRIKNIRQRDEFTPFREYLRRAHRRKLIGDLTLNDLKEVWDKQKGICPYTGIKLKIKDKNSKIHVFELASLDRIDSNKLYEKGNVIFVSTPINYMKNTMTEKETIKFCKIIASFWQTNGDK
jgi:hypothetical protein